MALVIGIPLAILLLVGVTVAIFGARQRSVSTGIPPSRRPGPTDQALEGRTLERYQFWGALLTVFLAVLFPVLYLREPTKQANAAESMLAESRHRGQETFGQFCARCHGANATGGVVKRFKPPGQPDAKPADFPAPDLTKIHERHPGERVADVAWDTIHQGRPGTPMPAWGVRYNGPMNEQQITDLTNWLVSIQGDGKPRDQIPFEQGPNATTPGKQQQGQQGQGDQ
jgi:mono/diheme cytochrome c family protein